MDSRRPVIAATFLPWQMGETMKESYREQPAIDVGHHPCAGRGDAAGVASSFAKASPYGPRLRRTDGGTSGCVETQASHPNSEIKIPACRPCSDKGKARSSSVLWQGEGGHGGVISSADEQDGSGLNPRISLFIWVHPVYLWFGSPVFMLKLAVLADTPVGRDGRDGRDGRYGRDGRDGRDGHPPFYRF